MYAFVYKCIYLCIHARLDVFTKYYKYFLNKNLYEITVFKREIQYKSGVHFLGFLCIHRNITMVLVNKLPLLCLIPSLCQNAQLPQSALLLMPSLRPLAVGEYQHTLIIIKDAFVFIFSVFDLHFTLIIHMPFLDQATWRLLRPMPSSTFSTCLTVQQHSTTLPKASGKVVAYICVRVSFDIALFIWMKWAVDELEIGESLNV